MSIFLNENSKVIVQGITGGEGTKHTAKMLAAGTNIVGGVNARKAGTTVSIGGKDLTVFGTVEEAMKETGADVSVVFVPPKFAKDAVIEAIDAEIPLAVVITEGIPVHDSAYFWAHACAKGNRTRIIGPNCPGVISPGRSNAGIIPADITSAGPIGLVSKSGTLTYPMMDRRRRRGTCRGVRAGQRDQAGRGLRRGVHRPGGQDDGTRRGHRVRVRGHRAGQEGGPGGRRGPGRQDTQ